MFDVTYKYIISVLTSGFQLALTLLSKKYVKMNEFSKTKFKKYIKDIIKKNNNINIIDKNGITPLHVAVLYNDYDMIKKMLEYGADANKQDVIGYNTPLQIAIDSGLDEIADLLINYTTDINSQDSGNFTAFHYAARSNNTKIMKKLLEKQADMSLMDNKNNLPIHYVVGYDNVEILKMIVKKEDIFKKNSGGKTPVDIAMISDSKESVRIMLNCYIEDFPEMIDNITLNYI